MTAQASDQAWISFAEACRIAQCSIRTLYAAADNGSIRRRRAGRRSPSLDRASVVTFAHRLERQRDEARQSRDEKAKMERACVSRHRGPDGESVWLSTATTATILDFTPQWVARLASTERLPGVRLDRTWWFRRSDIEIVAAARAFAQTRNRAEEARPAEASERTA